MPVNPVRFGQNRTSHTGRGLSPAIWGNCPIMDIISGAVDGLHFFDDFINTPTLSADSDTTGYATYIDTSNTITQVAGGTAGGALALTTDATDNDAPIIQAGGGTGGAFLIGNTAGNPTKLWFEARVKKSAIGDNLSAFFCGLAEEGLTADNGLHVDDTGASSSKDMIGFRNQHDNGEELDFIYRKAGQAEVEVIANIAAMVADTYFKVGFVFDMSFPAAERIRIFYNNQIQTTFVTSTNIDAATFPEDQSMSPILGFKNGAATATTVIIDWWRVAMVF